MGSTILVDPAMQKLKRELGADLYFLIFHSARDSLNLLNTIPPANVRTIRDKNIWTLAIDTLKYFWWVRREGIDTVIDLELFSRFTALLTGLSGTTRRVGFYPFHHEGLYRGEMLTHRVSYNPHIHISKNFIALAHALITHKAELPYSKVAIDDKEIQIQKVSFSEPEKSAMRAKISSAYSRFNPSQDKLILINPNASEMLPQRRWMPENYVVLIKKILSTRPNALILITGAPSERAQAEELKSAVNHDRCVNFAGHLRLTELPLLYSVSSFMITNDSGPAHFASITDMPTYVFFGPETPKLYGSLGKTTPIYAGLACSPCVAATNHRKTPCTDNVCLQVITPERAYAAIEPSL
jgi:ADP-heptose:LPS heptosyltransferase